mgnify:CR=1 FL=1
MLTSDTVPDRTAGTSAGRMPLVACCLFLAISLSPYARAQSDHEQPKNRKPTPTDSVRVDTSHVDTSHVDSSHAVPPGDRTGIQMRVRMPELRVEALRVPSDLSAAAPAFQIGAEAIRETGASSVSGILSQRSPAFLKQYGTTGSATLSLRGTQGTQSQVLLDGLRVTDPQTGQVDLSLVPSVMIRSIEVRQGATSARYGSGSLGGTVRLQTLRPTDSLHVRAAAETGSFGARSTSGVATGSVGRWRGLVSGQVASEDGDFAYANTALVPEETVRRRGAGLQTRTVFARLTAPSSGQGQAGLPGTWTLSGWHTAADRGLPGPANTASGGASQDTGLSRLWLSGDLTAGEALVQVESQYTHGRSRYRNPVTGRETGTTTQSGEMDVTASWSLENTVEDASIFHLWLRDAWLDVGATGRVDAAAINDDARQWTTAAFVDAEIGTRWLRLFPAARIDVISLQNADGFSRSSILPETDPVPSRTVTVNPRLGAEVRPFGSEAVRLTARVARAFRAPTFTERFYQPGGNPGLKNETGWSTDLGLRFQRSRRASLAVLQANVYQTLIQDQIVWAPSYVDSGVQVWSPSNIQRVDTRGLEVSAFGEKTLTSDVSIGGGALFTTTVAQNEANPNAASFGAQLPYVPRQQAKAWFDIDAFGISAGVSARAVSERFYTSDETRSVPPYQIASAYLGYAHDFQAGRLTFRLNVDNLLDQDYAIVRLYPMPPRNVSARLALML